ncbi:hypothetical protein WOLCODRAFT_154394 [Wolfiporia cocos MD-104 SS10]|uniref:Uncharacterized protein n=1 Tax=Wolfiporia cocos (strain MD-104) TaxID=742152 RepID=A0A2H3K5M0_WOLCO|nr:hypothetical protein WOLCODRAFT_154394 [Wolfiporia cocos MD-104 SS10]
MPRRRLTARRHGNDDDTRVITTARRPPLGKEPAPVATSAALSRSPADSSLHSKDVRRRRRLASAATSSLVTWTLRRSAHHHRHPPSPPLRYTAKTVGPTMPPGSSLGRRPCLAVKLGSNAHHVTSNAELLDGSAFGSDGLRRDGLSTARYPV